MLEIKSLCRADQKLGYPEPINITVKNGSSLAIVGKSGAGKSLLLRAIADIDETSGEIFINDINKNSVKGYEWRKMAVYVASDAGWWHEIVGDHFKNKEKTLSYINELDLPSDIINWQISRLSNGEKQRLSLIRALLLEPEVLILDEPTSALDMHSVQKTEQLLKTFLKNKKIIVFSTHNLEQARRIADSIITVEKGIIKNA